MPSQVPPNSLCATLESHLRKPEFEVLALLHLNSRNEHRLTQEWIKRAPSSRWLLRFGPEYLISSLPPKGSAGVTIKEEPGRKEALGVRVAWVAGR
ncbi:hypothetical protein BaRGS_00034547 [Batillaria attramentaria]|uniref:Uncharacterized protein n=1 Tax=Batillaria attramentaria TaxID=370345 RepID=A0ABD0JHM3_9CAEN